VVVDDGSTDGSYGLAKGFPCKVVRLQKNSGPAVARNTGVENSSGGVLVFVDVDTEMKEDALEFIDKTLKEHPRLYGVIGLPLKKSLRGGIAPSYIALENYFTLASAKTLYTSYFTTQIGAIKREVFERLGGFDTRYRTPDIEDIEFGTRLMNGNKIFINKHVFVDHHFPAFWPAVKKFFKRSYLWAEVLSRKKRFHNAHMTRGRFYGILSACITAAFFVPSIAGNIFLYPTALFSAIFLAVNSHFFLFVFRERGFLFMLEAVCLKFIFSITIGLGGVAYTMDSVLFRLSGKRVFKYLNRR